MTQNIVLKTEHLTKRYGKKIAVDGVSMTVKKGDIYGLIGKNGAGKSTLARMITALTMPDDGSIELFGEKTPALLNAKRRRIGCVVEMPAFYPNSSARQNLEYYCVLKGIPDKSIIDRTLKMVGLADTGKKSFKNFSLGMKQRLGLALSLLNSPDFIILDEPINGLDPMGIVEMRKILKTLNEEHSITILISSHILAELSLIATRYGIINDGKLIKELTNEELLENCQRCLSITVDNPVKASQIFETELKTTKYKIINKNTIRLYDYLDNAAEVNFKLNNAGVFVASVSEVSDNLEEYFVKLIGGEKHYA